MIDDSDRFTDAERHSIGVCVSQLGEHVRTLRGHGVNGPTLDQFEQALDEFANDTRAKKPQPPRNAINATLVQMLVLEEELRPRRMTGYGPLSDVAARILDGHVQRLLDLTNALIARRQHTRL